MIKNIGLILLTLSLCKAEAQSFQAVVQKGHGEAVKAARFSADGKYLFTASRDKTIKLWDAATGMEMRTFFGHAGTVGDVSLHRDKMATSSTDGHAIVWDIPSGSLLWKSRKFSRYVSSVSFSPDGQYLAVGSGEDSVCIYNTATYQLEKTLKTNPELGLGYGIHVHFSPDGRYLAVGEDDRAAKLYAVADWEFLYEVKPPLGSCGGCATLTSFTTNGEQFLKLSNGATLMKLDAASGDVLFEYPKEFREIRSVAFQNSGENYLAATEDSVFVFKNKNNQLISKFAVAAELHDASFHPNNETIVMAVDKRVLIVDLQGNEVRRFDGVLNHTSTGLDYQLGSYFDHYIAKWVKYKSARWVDNTSIYIGKTGLKARKWNLSTMHVEMEYIGHEKGVLCFEKVDEKRIATGGGDGNIMIWESKTGQLHKTLKGHREPVFDIKVSHDGAYLASCAWDGVINIWDTETWERYQYMYNEGNSAYHLAFTENDAYLVVGLLDKTLRLLEIETMQFVKEYVGHTNVVTSIQQTRDEIVTSGWDGQVVVWDLYSGLIKKRLKTGKAVFSAVGFNDLILFAGADRAIHLWNRNTGKLETSLKGHQAEINGLQVEGTRLVSSDVDGTTKFWDLSNKKELFEHIQMGANDWMVKTPEGYFDATDNAISNIHFVRGLEVVGSSQVLETFFAPGLVKNISIKRKAGATLGDAMNQSPPPVLKLSGLAQADGSAKLFLKAEDRGGGIHRIKLYHNGKRIAFDAKKQETRSEANTRIFAVEVPMVGGTNAFSATAQSKSGIESNRPETTLFSNSTKPASTCHILAIGINKYKNAALNLNYAKPDAVSFAEQLEKQSAAIYSQVEVYEVLDDEATKPNILARIRELKDKISVNDVFVFYYAGHGSMVDGNFYLVSSSASRLYDNAKMMEFGIDAQALQAALLDIKALKQLIIMDACQSGGSVEVLAQRGSTEEKAIAQLSRSSGIHVMAAAGSDQYATEFESLGHGIFTYTLLKGLEGEADGAPKDGKVTIYELKSYLDDQVPELSIEYKGSPQYPHTFSRGQDFPIVIVNDKQ